MRLRRSLDCDADVGAIEDAVAEAQSGDGGVLVLRGPAWVGTSPLLRVAGGRPCARQLFERPLEILRNGTPTTITRRPR